MRHHYSVVRPLLCPYCHKPYCVEADAGVLGERRMHRIRHKGRRNYGARRQKYYIITESLGR